MTGDAGELATTATVADFASFIKPLGNIDDLLGDIERTGVAIGVDRRLRLMSLLIRLGACGPAAGDRSTIAAILVAALATSNDEQAEIAPVVAAWLDRAPQRGGSPIAAARRETRPRKLGLVATVTRLDRSGLQLAAGAVLGVAGLFVTLLLLKLLVDAKPVGEAAREIITTPSPIVNLSPQLLSDPAWLEDILSRLIYGGGVLAFGLTLLGWRGHAKARLSRQIGETDLVERLEFSASAPAWFRSGMARRAFDRLKRSRYVETDRIDVRRSIAQTVRAGGEPRMVRKLLRERPHYVLFVDRSGHRDHADLLARMLEAAIHGADIVYTRYDYVDRPLRLNQVRDGRPDVETLPLSVVASRHAGERLIVVGTGGEFFERPGVRHDRAGRRIVVAPGTPFPGLVHLREFSIRFVLTPLVHDAWGATERHLAELGLLVLPATVGGVDEIAALLTRDPDQLSGFAAASAQWLARDRFLAGLDREAVRYAADIPPPEAEITCLINDLRDWLGDEQLFVLVAAIAIFPKIDPTFTLILAKLVLAPRDRELDIAVFNRLLQLPWLRQGRVPDWLRIALANALDPDGLQTVRQVQLAMLSRLDRSGPGPVTADELVASFEVARELTGAALDATMSRIDAHELLDADERIFVSVMRGVPLDPQTDVLRPEAPAAIVEQMNRAERRRKRQWIAGIAAFAVLAAAVQPWFTTLSNRMSEVVTPAVDAVRERVIGAAQAVFPPVVGLVCRDAALLAALSAGILWLLATFRSWPTALLASRVVGIAGVLLAAAGLAIRWRPDSGFVLPGEPVDGVVTVAAGGVLLWTWVIRAEQWWRSPSADDAWPERLWRDDWIASTLGALLIGLLVVVPSFVLAFPLLDAALKARTLVPADVVLALGSAGIAWAAGLHLMRRWLIGAVPGASAARGWLDALFGSLVLLVVWSCIQVLPQPDAVPRTGLAVATMFLILPFAWFCSARAALGLTSPAGPLTAALRLFVKGFVVCVPAVPALAALVESTPRGVDVQLWAIGISGLPIVVWGMAETLAVGRRSDAAIGARSRRLTVILLLCVGAGAIPYAVADGVLDLPPLTRKLLDDGLTFWALFVPPILAFWPIVRFVGAASAVPRERWSAGLGPWWGVPAMWLAAVPWGGPAPTSILALPIAAGLAWLGGPRAIVPIAVGTLPFWLEVAGLAGPGLPGGFWPSVAILLWSRLIASAGLRDRVLRRERLAWADVAIIVLALAVSSSVPLREILAVAAPDATALGMPFWLGLAPPWMLTTVALIVGASRMPRYRLAIGILVAAAVHLATGPLLLGAAAVDASVGFPLADVLTALVALFAVPAWRGTPLRGRGTSFGSLVREWAHPEQIAFSILCAAAFVLLLAPVGLVLVSPRWSQTVRLGPEAVAVIAWIFGMRAWDRDERATVAAIAVLGAAGALALQHASGWRSPEWPTALAAVHLELMPATATLRGGWPTLSLATMMLALVFALTGAVVRGLAEERLQRVVSGWELVLQSISAIALWTGIRRQDLSPPADSRAADPAPGRQIGEATSAPAARAAATSSANEAEEGARPRPPKRRRSAPTKKAKVTATGNEEAPAESGKRPRKASTRNAGVTRKAARPATSSKTSR